MSDKVQLGRLFLYLRLLCNLHSFLICRGNFRLHEIFLAKTAQAVNFCYSFSIFGIPVLDLKNSNTTKALCEIVGSGSISAVSIFGILVLENQYEK